MMCCSGAAVKPGRRAWTRAARAYAAACAAQSAYSAA